MVCVWNSLLPTSLSVQSGQLVKQMDRWTDGQTGEEPAPSEGTAPEEGELGAPRTCGLGFEVPGEQP